MWTLSCGLLPLPESPKAWAKRLTRSCKRYLPGGTASGRQRCPRHLTTNQASEEEGGQKVYWETSDKTVATVDKNGTVRARTDSGECTITATLADGTESISCLVRIGDITVPVFATGQLAGQRSNDEVSLADVAALKARQPIPSCWMRAAVCTVR